MTIINRERYSCSAKRERGTCTNPTGIQAAELEDRVITGLKDILLGQEALIEVFAQEFNKELERLRKTRGSRDRQLHKELSQVSNSIRRCLAFITGGDGDPGLVRHELAALEARKRTLERQLQADTTSQAIIPHPNTGALYARKVTELQSLLADEAARPQTMDIIRSLIDRIEVHAGTTRGKADVILVGALASILQFTWHNQQGAQTQTAASGEGGGGRVLMVA